MTTNLSSSITPLWPWESWAFVGPVTEYTDLVFILQVMFYSNNLTALNRQCTRKWFKCNRTKDIIAQTWLLPLWLPINRFTFIHKKNQQCSKVWKAYWIKSLRTSVKQLNISQIFVIIWLLRMGNSHLQFQRRQTRFLLFAVCASLVHTVLGPATASVEAMLE